MPADFHQPLPRDLLHRQTTVAHESALVRLHHLPHGYVGVVSHPSTADRYIIQMVDDVPVRLRKRHDLAWLAKLGTVFTVLDEQDSGNVCFGVDTGRERLFVKFAGADPFRRSFTIDGALATLRNAAILHEEFGGELLAPLLESFTIADGFALVLPWIDAVPLGLQYQQSHLVRAHPLQRRIDWVAQCIDFHCEVDSRGWVAVDFYDGSVMATNEGNLVLCDLDFYQRAPLTNTDGRMPGSTRFMAPEEFEHGATIDGITTQVALAALAHALLGDSRSKSQQAWQAPEALFRVAERAGQPDRADRYPDLTAFATAWRAAAT